MRLPTNVLLTSMTFAAILLTPGCTKKFDLDSTSQELRHCPIKKLIARSAGFDKNPLDSTTAENDFSYNAAGNPVAVIPSGFSSPANFYYFRYDRQNRLTDYQIAYAAGASAVVWHRYSYLRNGTILDSLYAYGDMPINAPAPPLASFEGSLTNYQLDGKGRVVKATETFPLSPGTDPFISTYDYDANGDLILQGITYDNKINPAQTNGFWMFLALDYSDHNPIANNTMPFAAFTYDSYGLPTARVVLPNDGFFSRSDFFAQFYGDNTTFFYGCDIGMN